jgi:hypothetical protein
VVAALTNVGATNPRPTSIDATMKRIPIRWRPDMTGSPMTAEAESRAGVGHVVE